jgi:uncharacterized protein DUF1552
MLVLHQEVTKAMMIFKKAIPRRTFLRGVGATLALPLLDGMIPAFASTPGAAKAPLRLAFVYVPNGVIDSPYRNNQWTPAAEGSGFEMTPTLQPLTPFRDQLLVLSGLDSKGGLGLQNELGGEHPRASAAYLTGVHTDANRIGDKTVRAGISIDQVAARELKKHTQLASLELGIEPCDLAGSSDGDTNAYTNTVCWADATTPLPMENQPRAVFERLFGDSDSTSKAEQIARTQANRSILDFVTQAASRLASDLGASDRAKISQYLDAVRDVERRIQMAEEQSSRELPVVQRPPGIPAKFSEHIKLMFDLQALAFQCDLTRVSTVQAGHEMSSQTYPEIGINDPHHPFTHHQGDPQKIEKAAQVNLFHMQMFAYSLEKLRSTPDGDGSLLDHSMIVYGSGLSDGNLHLPLDLPILLVGGGAGQLKGNRHLKYPQKTPLANLFLTLLDKLGIPTENFGDGTGELELLSV